MLEKYNNQISKYEQEEQQHGKVLMISQDDMITDPKLCGEYTPKTGMSMAKRCADFYNVMRGRLPGKFIASNIVYMFITGNPLPGKDSDKAKKIRGYTSAANKYSLGKHGLNIVSAKGFGARMSVDKADHVINSESLFNRQAAVNDAVILNNSGVDVSEVPNNAKTSQALARFMAAQAIVTNPTVIKSIATLKYLAPQAEDKKKK